MQRLLFKPVLLALILMTAACGSSKPTGTSVAETDYSALFENQASAPTPVKKKRAKDTSKQNKFIKTAGSKSQSPIEQPAPPQTSTRVPTQAIVSPQESGPAKSAPVVLPKLRVRHKKNDGHARPSPIETVQAPVVPAQPPRVSAPSATPPATPAPTATANMRGFWDHEVQQGRRWTVFTAEALEKYAPGLIDSHPGDIREFCPAYSSLDRKGRKVFWINFVSAVAFKESSFRPSDSYVENFRNSSGNAVVSRGLMGLSLESSQLYACRMNTERDLEDPKLNLECGVKILGKWVMRTGRLSGHIGGHWVGASRYWGVMRTPNKAAAIKRATNSLDFCKN